jgi:hypothetical protein
MNKNVALRPVFVLSLSGLVFGRSQLAKARRTVLGPMRCPTVVELERKRHSAMQHFRAAVAALTIETCERREASR